MIPWGGTGSLWGLKRSSVIYCVICLASHFLSPPPFFCSDGTARAGRWAMHIRLSPPLFPRGHIFFKKFLSKQSKMPLISLHLSPETYVLGWYFFFPRCMYVCMYVWFALLCILIFKLTLPICKKGRRKRGVWKKIGLHPTAWKKKNSNEGSYGLDM